MFEMKFSNTAAVIGSRLSRDIKLYAVCVSICFIFRPNRYMFNTDNGSESVDGFDPYIALRTFRFTVWTVSSKFIRSFTNMIIFLILEPSAFDCVRRVLISSDENKRVFSIAVMYSSAVIDSVYSSVSVSSGHLEPQKTYIFFIPSSLFICMILNTRLFA